MAHPALGQVERNAALKRADAEGVSEPARCRVSAVHARHRHHPLDDAPARHA